MMFSSYSNVIHILSTIAVVAVGVSADCKPVALTNMGESVRVMKINGANRMLYIHSHTGNSWQDRVVRGWRKLSAPYPDNVKVRLSQHTDGSSKFWMICGEFNFVKDGKKQQGCLAHVNKLGGPVIVEDTGAPKDECDERLFLCTVNCRLSGIAHTTFTIPGTHRQLCESLTSVRIVQGCQNPYWLLPLA